MVIDNKLIQGFKDEIDARRDKVVIDDKLIQGLKNQVGVLTNLSAKVADALGRATDQYNIVKDNRGKKLVDVIPADKPKK
jgi:hypothetical protein